MKTIIDAKELKAAMKELNKVKTDKAVFGSDLIKIESAPKGIGITGFNGAAYMIKNIPAAETVTAEGITLSDEKAVTVNLETATVAGEPLNIWYNYNYILDALKEIDKAATVKISFTSPLNPFIITDPENNKLRLLVTPIRTSSN